MRLIGFGGENLVFLKEDKVLKYPFGIRYLINPNETIKELTRDIRILEKHFGKYFLDTQIGIVKKRFFPPFYRMSQTFVDGKPLKRHHLKDPFIKKQYEEIMSINKKMTEEDKISYEFFGAYILVFSHLIKRVSNILVEKNTHRLYIIDVGVLYLRDEYHSKLLSFIYRWAYKKQTTLLNGFSN